jgi:IS5 family transposase
MLRIHLMQHWYALSDPAMEDALIEVPTMRRFAGIDLISERIPDETTILTFRNLLEKHDLGEKIFETIERRRWLSRMPATRELPIGRRWLIRNSSLLLQ